MASSINASLTAGIVQTADTSGNLNLQSGGTTIAAITSTGVAVTGTLSASGAVTIPDVAGSFYSTGTWTPSQGAGLTMVGAFSSGGTWTKVGTLVTVWGYVAGATTVAVAASNAAFCGNLPFTPNANSTCGALGINGNTTASIALQPTGTSTTIFAAGTMAATARINFSATYQV